MSSYATKNVNGVDVPLNPDEIAELEARDAEWAAGEVDRKTEATRLMRAAAMVAEADPLFFKYQAGEIPKEDWEAKRTEIRARYPYPDAS